MNSFRLLQIQLEIECITFDHNGDLMRMPCPDPDDVPRVYAAQFAQGIQILYRRDVSPQLRAAINALAPDTAFHSPQRLVEILQNDAPCKTGWTGTSYVFAQRVPPDAFPDVTRMDRSTSELFRDVSDMAEQMVFTILQNGRIVSACESARENKAAGEAWVRTEPAFQRRGYAAQTTLAWAYDLQQKNKIPFYSHKQENIASEQLARRLGITPWLKNVIFV